MRRSVRRGMFAGMLCASVLLLAACGVTTGATNATQTPGGAQASPSASPSATASAAATLTLQPGTVAIALDQSHYTTSDTINATILNGLDHTIYAADHHTDCTVLVVEQQSDSGWQSVGRCLLATVTRLVPFAASSQTAVQLAIGQAGNGGVTWGAGTYRISLSYVNSDLATPDSGSTVYSATFTLS